jgi:hypothetical protein
MVYGITCLSAFLPDHNFRTEEHPGILIDTRQNLQSIQPTFLETGILFYSTGALSAERACPLEARRAAERVKSPPKKPAPPRCCRERPHLRLQPVLRQPHPPGP